MKKMKFEIVEFLINLFYNLFFLGLKRFKSDLKLMLGKSPNFYWIICFKILTPIFTIVLFFNSFFNHYYWTLFKVSCLWYFKSNINSQNFNRTRIHETRVYVNRVYDFCKLLNGFSAIINFQKNLFITQK